jgi:hypothetical protein
VAHHQLAALERGRVKQVLDRVREAGEQQAAGPEHAERLAQTGRTSGTNEFEHGWKTSANALVGECPESRACRPSTQVTSSRSRSATARSCAS